jgi:small nuclear ribonucleoprotein (snRNP)-like protein
MDTSDSILCILTVFMIFIAVGTTKSLPLVTHNAFADGLAQEQISSSLGNRRADLLVKMDPPVVTTETLKKGQNPILEFRLFDTNTNKSFSHVTYFISIQKEGKKLLSDWFHSHDGDLRIVIKNTNASRITVSSQELEPITGSYIGTKDNPAAISGPIFLNGGLYQFKVRIATVDSDTSVLSADEQRLYNSLMSIGDTKSQPIDIEGKRIPIKITSYYDRIKDFKFDNKTMQMQFDMPFNWNTSRINKTSIFVHQEISVPKPNAFTANKSYVGTVNGVDISKNIMLDDTPHQNQIIHVMLPKNTIIQLADRESKKDILGNIMEFSIKPSSSKGSTPSMGNMPMSGS